MAEKLKEADMNPHDNNTQEAQVCYTVGLIFLAVLALLTLLGILN